MAAGLTSRERSQRARIGAHAKWAQCDDPSAATAPGRTKFMERFELEVDPEGKLPPDERARRAEHKRKEYFARLAFRSARARRKKAGKAGDANGGAPGRKDAAELVPTTKRKATSHGESASE
jgi:hypothetical protein